MSDEQIIARWRAAYGHETSESSIRSRRATLTDDGYIADSGLRTTTVRGRESVRWALTEKGAKYANS